jgi:hypothetical protein
MTSGSNSGLRPYTAIQLIEEAARRAGITVDKLTSEIGEASLDQLNLVFTSLVNRGVQLWKRQQLILPCYVNESQILLPPGFNIVTTLNRRSLMGQYGGTAFSDSGGVAANAFDQNFATSCLQTVPNGSIGMDYTALGGVQITTVGVCFAVAGIFSLFYEYSPDGVTWTPVDAATATVNAPGQWLWTDLNGYPDIANRWRVRSVGASNLSVEEIQFANTPTEINLGPWNLDEYAQQPNKNSSGPVTNWYQQRNLGVTTLYVYQVPGDAQAFDQLVCWATQYLDDVTQIAQSLDVPMRWYDAITAMLARRLCRSLPGVADFERYPMLKSEEDEAVALAEGEERDPAPTNYDLNIDAYTR